MVIRRGVTCTCQTPFCVVVRATVRNTELGRAFAWMTTCSPSAPDFEIDPWRRTDRNIGTTCALWRISTERVESTTTVPCWFGLTAPWYLKTPPLGKTRFHVSPGFSTGDFQELSSATIWRLIVSSFFPTTASPFWIETTGGNPNPVIAALFCSAGAGGPAARAN